MTLYANRNRKIALIQPRYWYTWRLR